MTVPAGAAYGILPAAPPRPIFWILSPTAVRSERRHDGLTTTLARLQRAASEGGAEEEPCCWRSSAASVRRRGPAAPASTRQHGIDPLSWKSRRFTVSTSNTDDDDGNGIFSDDAKKQALSW